MQGTSGSAALPSGSGAFLVLGILAGTLEPALGYMWHVMGRYVSFFLGGVVLKKARKWVCKKYIPLVIETHLLLLTHFPLYNHNQFYIKNLVVVTYLE